MEISKIAIGKENPMIPLTGSSVKRKRLSDITNTVSSSISNAQFQEKSKEVSCIITKDCFQQILEENARLLKTLGERNKIIEFTSIELRRLRIMLEKANQQNRSLAQANSQIQSELTLSKERLKAFQHELGCTVAVLRSTKSELDEKNQLNKELIVKIRIQSERSKLAEITAEGRQVGNSMACRLDRDSQLDEEKLNNGQCEETKAKATEDYVCAEVATGISLSHPVSNSRVCISKRKTPDRSKALGSTTLTDEAKDKPNNESRETIRSEAEHSNCADVATDALRSHPAGDKIVCEPNRKRITRSQSLGAATTVTHQVEVKEKDFRRRSSRKISNMLTSEASESEDYLPVVVDAEIPAFLAISELPDQVEAKEKDDTRTQKSTQRKSNTLKSEACKSKDYLPGIVDAQIPVCSVMSEPPNRVEVNEKDDLRTRKSFQSRSSALNSEACESKDYLLEIVDDEIPACSVMSEPPDQVETAQQDDTRIQRSLRSRSNTLKSEARESKDHLLEVEGDEILACSVISEPSDQVEAKQEDDKRTRKSMRRSSNILKSEAHESKNHLPPSAHVKKPTFSTIIEPPNEEKIDNLMKGKDGNAQKDQITTTASEGQGQDLRRTSVGRPMRQAAGKIGSYKEIPLNVKMRRPASLPQ